MKVFDLTVVESIDRLAFIMAASVFLEHINEIRNNRKLSDSQVVEVIRAYHAGQNFKYFNSTITTATYFSDSESVEELILESDEFTSESAIRIIATCLKEDTMSDREKIILKQCVLGFNVCDILAVE